MKSFYLFLVLLLFCLPSSVHLYINGEHLAYPTPDLLYDNVRIHHPNGNETQVGTCAGNVIHLDYSFQFNSVVAICDSNHKGTVHIFPLDKSHPAKLSANQLVLGNIESPHKSYYAFDWSTGLLYFTEVHTIWVVDLKQPPALSETSVLQYEQRLLKVYQSTRLVTITGLIVRPDNSSLIWLEFSTINGTRIDFMQASQAGKEVTKLFELKMRLEGLLYDYFFDRFMVLSSRNVDQEHNGYIFRYENVNDFKQWFPFKIKLLYRMSDNLFLYGDWVLYVKHVGIEATDIKKTFITRWNISGNSEVEPHLVSRERFNNQTFTLIDDSKRIHPSEDGRCGKDGEQSVCSQQEFDFCIPNNQTTFICKSSPSIFKIVSSVKWVKWVIYTTLICLVFLLILATVAWVLTKKRMQFYQIKLKSINRVNSSKLDAKSEAMEEVAE